MFLFLSSINYHNKRKPNQNKHEPNHNKREPNQNKHDPNHNKREPNQNKRDPNHNKHEPNQNKREPNQNKHDPNHKRMSQIQTVCAKISQRANSRPVNLMRVLTQYKGFSVTRFDYNGA